MTTPADEINWADTPCARLFSQGVDLWFDHDTAGRGNAPETPAETRRRERLAKAECATCPLQAECATRGEGEHGIWGGRTSTERHNTCGDRAGTTAGLKAHRYRRETPCPACADVQTQISHARAATGKDTAA